MRILIAKMEIAGVAHGLRTGLSALGCDVSMAIAQPHPFEYGSPNDGTVARTWLGLGGLIRAYKGRFVRRVLLWLLWKAWSWVVLAWAITRFDSYIFIFGRSITDTRFEDFLHKILGHRLLFVYCGSDIRPPYIDGPACYSAAGASGAKLASMARRMARQLHRRERLGFVSLNSPLTGQFHSKPYVNWFSIGVPRDIPQSEAPSADAIAGDHRVVHILHSPSHPEIKGSDLIRETVERLRAKGHQLEFVELRGVANAVVVDELRKCDFIIDQLYSDTPMAGFATEAAMFGKPAVVGSYAAGRFADRQDQWSLPPSLCVHPDELEAAIETLVVDAIYRRDLGRKAREFVREFWSLEAVTRRYLRLLSGDIPSEWLVSPGFDYVEGCGLSASRVRASIASVIASGGPHALRLGHSPALERAFVDFAAGASLDRRP